MIKFASAVTLALALPIAGHASTVSAPTIGVAVAGANSDTFVGTSDAAISHPAPNGAETSGLLGSASGSGAVASDIIGYFIPLAGADCTYGVSGCGLTSDRGLGGVNMDMWLKFANVEGGASTLNLYFEDLDLINGNDPVGFFESVTIYDGAANLIEAVTYLPSSDPSQQQYSNVTVSGDADTQQAISADIGTLVAGNDYWARLVLSANVSTDFIDGSSRRKCEKGLNDVRTRRYTAPQLVHKFCPKNTPEFLLATVTGTHTPEVVPLPAAGWMLLAGVGGLAAMRRRKKAA